MAPKVGDILKRLGLRGAIIRYGEQWKTQEVKDLEDDIRAFYQKYEPYLKREEEYPFEFNTDINDILEKHGPVLWPDGPRSEDTTLWLFPAGEISEYLEDIYYSRHFDKIQPLFATLLTMRVKVYRSNQRHAELKAKEKREAEAAAAAAAAAANASTNDPDHALSDSDLTDFDSHDESPSLVHVIKFDTNQSKAKLQEFFEAEEVSLRKRKFKTDSPLRSVKRSKQSRVPSEPIEPSQNLPTWTTTNADMIRVASPFQLGHEHDLLVAAASGHTHGFVPVNRPEQNEQPAQHVSDSDEDGSVLGRTAMSLHSSDGSSPNHESQHLPETPGEGVLLHTQYALPQDTNPSAQTSESAPKSPQHGQPLQSVAPISEISPEATLQPQVTDQFMHWPKLNKRKAKRSKTTLRPMVNTEEMEPPAQPIQSLTEPPMTHAPGLPTLPPTPQQDESFASVNDDNGTESRKLTRRTHVLTPATEPSKQPTDNTSTATPSASQHNITQINHFTPLSTHTQARTYQTPYANSHPLVPNPQSNPTPVDAVPGVVNSHPAPIDSPLTMSGPIPTIVNKQNPLPIPSDMPVSAQIITNHFANTFVRFTLTVNGRSSHKNIKLADCFDVVALHQTVNNRFKYGLSGQVPSEIVFIFADEEFGIDTPDESGQSLWDEFMQMIVSNAPAGTCPITAAVRV
ncbi:hypothetical protein KCU95_g13804, partial [Aureobasidium melanogenum]